MKWSKNKIAKIYEYYKLNLSFPFNRRHSNIQGIKSMNEAIRNFCMDAIKHNSNLSTLKIFKLLSEFELEIIIDKRTIVKCSK